MRHVPELKRNLISLGTLDKKGCGYNYDRGSLEIYKGKNLIMRGVRKNELYSLVGQIIVADDCYVYWKCHKNEKPIYLLLYVDDMLLASQPKHD